MAPWRLSSAHFMPDMAVPIGPLRAVLCRCRHKKPWLLLVEGQLRASTLGAYIIRWSYSVGVAFSRKRYTQSDIVPSIGII